MHYTIVFFILVKVPRTSLFYFFLLNYPAKEVVIYTIKSLDQKRIIHERSKRLQTFTRVHHTHNERKHATNPYLYIDDLKLCF